MEKVISFRLTGKEFNNEKYNIKHLVDAVNTFQKLLDSSYSTIIGKSKLNDRDRENFKIYAKNIRSGSFETDLLIQVGFISGNLLQNIPTGNPIDIWRIAKDSFNYLKAIYENNSKGRNIMIKVEDSPGVNVVVNSNDVRIEASSEVIEAANKAKGTLSDYSRKIEKVSGVEGFEAFDHFEKKDSIKFSREDIYYFKNEPVTEDEIIKIKGIYTNANISSMTGKIKVTDAIDSSIELSEYTFKFINKEIEEKSFREGFVKERVYFVQRKLRYNVETQTKDVIGLNIINIDKM